MRRGLLLATALILMLATLPLTPYRSAKSQGTGDWLVTGTEVRQGEMIVLNGNLIVLPGGNLTLVNCTLVLNSTSTRTLNITVRSGGSLYILANSTVMSADPAHYYDFLVQGRLVVRDSAIYCPSEILVQSNEGVFFERAAVVFGRNNAIYCMDSSNVLVLNTFFIDNGNCGFRAYRSCDINLTGCAAYGNRYGIYLSYSNSTTISSCSIDENAEKGLYCEECFNVTIFNCAIADSGGYGAHFWGSYNITLRYNSFTRDGLFIEHGFSTELRHYASFKIEGNVVNGKPLYYVVNSSGVTVPSDAGEVIVVNSTNVQISGANLSSTDVGVEVVLSDSVTISNCVFYGDYYALYYFNSSNIQADRLDVKNSSYAVYCEYANFTLTNSIIREGGDGIYIFESKSAEVHFCDIFSNKRCGMCNWGSYEVNATYNWWGSSNGPNATCMCDAEDPEEVCGLVLYNPWSSTPYNDKYPPTVSIDAPKEGAYVRKTITVKASASDDLKVANVTICVNGTKVAALSKPPYEYAWSTEGVSDGVYNITVIACDFAGRKSAESVIVTVDNTPPSASIKSPAPASFVRGTITIEFEASDAYGIEKAILYVDGRAVAVFPSLTYKYELNTTSLPDGLHNITVVVYDRAGNSYSTTINVTVDNTPPSIGNISISPEEPVEGEEVTVSAEASDATSGIAEAILSYSTDGGTTWKNVSMTATGANVYEATIPGQPANTTVLFKVLFRDAAGNWASSSEQSYTVGTAAPAPAKPAAPAIPVAYIAGAIAAVVVAVGVALYLLKKKRTS